MDFDNSNLMYWILLMAVGIIGFLIGFFLRGNGSQKGILEELETVKSENQGLKNNLQNCQQELEENKASQFAAPTSIPFDFKAAKAVFKKTIKKDDLKLIEGIGPKIESLFHNFEIKTWKALSDISVSKCQEVLDSGGERYRVHDPASWPMQAKMCYEGKWKELYRWQEEHKHGKL